MNPVVLNEVTSPKNNLIWTFWAGQRPKTRFLRRDETYEHRLLYLSQGSQFGLVSKQKMRLQGWANT
jgi:hypothetical protein